MSASLYGSRPQLASQVLVAVVVLAYVGSTVVVRPPASGYSSFWDGWMGNIASIVPLVPVVLRIRSTKHLRGAWISMATGAVLYNAGNLIYLWHDQNLNPIPSPAPSDAAYLASYVFFAIGVVMLTQRHFGAVRISTRLDGAITGLAIGSAAGMLWFDSVLKVSGRPLQVVVGMAYPLMDMVLIVILISGLAPLRYRPNVPTSLLMLGMTSFVIGDVVYLNEVAANTYVQGTLLDSTWVIGIWLMCVAAWPHDERRETPRTRTTSLPRGLSSIPIIFGSLSVLILVISLVHHTSWVTSLLALSALCLVIVRMAMTLREVRGAEEESFRSARIDVLTGLGNRRAFFESGDGRFEALDDGRRLGIVLVDLDGFKEINDSLGHASGDELLQIVSRRFENVNAGRGEISRIGGDEFACTFDVGSVAEVVAIGNEMAQMIATPIAIGGMTVRVSASMGIAVYPDHGSVLSDLLRCADIAMYEAKQSRMVVRLYRSEGDSRTRDQLALLDDLRTVVWESELVLHFQPTLDLRTSQIRGVEALARWRHPTFGLLYPNDFVPLAERTGLIHVLTTAVLHRAIDELSQLHRNGYELQMSVNISRYDLLDDELPDLIAGLLAHHGLEASWLTLEITESSLVEEPAHSKQCIERIRAQGVHISIDDFGVGYSSMSQLLQLSVDELKIDKSFVLALGVDDRARAVISATIELARALKLTVVAEGIENVHSLAVVSALGVDLGQGYFVAVPFSSRQLAEFLANPDAVSAAGAKVTRAALRA
ncbi:MAG TPA: EAL domain-containing protein [Acidimicrobiales bacterium]|nr:EAL domain-containing protein [Acidimicrobiales bacterium]